MPGGGFLSNVIDVAKFGLCLQRKDVLSENMRELAWRPANPKINAYYGLGFSISYDPYGNRYSVGHDGAQDKTRTSVRYYEHENKSIAIMTNCEYANTPEIVKLIEGIIFN
jgi:CubicO group peptidase (beta-lactamase class C family)